MNSGPRTVIIFAIALLLGVELLPAQARDTLTHDDLTIRDLGEDGDTAMTRRLLGAPLRVVRHDERNEDGALLVDWYYHDVGISFHEGRPYFVEVTGRTVATSRGVRVGDPRAKVRTAYGRPMHEDVSHLLYANEAETRGIIFFLTGDRVTRILVGHVISLE